MDLRAVVDDLTERYLLPAWRENGRLTAELAIARSERDAALRRVEELTDEILRLKGVPPAERCYAHGGEHACGSPACELASARALLRSAATERKEPASCRT